MPDHRIRLRGAWARHDPGQTDSTRVDLPFLWPAADAEGSFTLRRAFGAPPIDPDRESVELEINDAPGLVALRLNGISLDFPDAPCFSLPIGPHLQRRNTVEIEVAGLVATDQPWGLIALRIVAR